VSNGQYLEITDLLGKRNKRRLTANGNWLLEDTLALHCGRLLIQTRRSGEKSEDKIDLFIFIRIAYSFCFSWGNKLSSLDRGMGKREYAKHTAETVCSVVTL
jgi:hypothetical protein